MWEKLFDACVKKGELRRALDCATRCSPSEKKLRQVFDLAVAEGALDVAFACAAAIDALKPA